MKDILEHALNTIEVSRAGYGDVRLVTRRAETIATKDGVVEALEQYDNQGIGIRVLVDGAWGFAATSSITKKDVERVVRQAIRLARAAARVNATKVTLAKVPSSKATFKTSYKIDPFLVPLSDKIEMLLKADAAQRSDKKIKISQAFLRAWREQKTFASTEGAWIEQELTECGGGIEATAVSGDEVQNRSYPNSFRGQSQTCGYELIEELDLVGNAAKVGLEAAQLLQAPQCPAGQFDLILDGNQVALQVHESCGHPCELDRVFGMEASYAGTSFLTPEKRGKLKYGSKHVTISADATLPRGLGTYGFDDEGVAAQRSLLVDTGQFVGYLTSRETSDRVGLTPNGTMRADGWSRLPLIRMTNINLEPGGWKLGDLIADTKDGFFLTTNRSWSIDDRRLNFQFGTEVAWEIKDGKLGRIFKNPIYSGITPQFWGSCDAVCTKNHWVIWGTPNCGKGEPSQVAHVGHGASPARFRNVAVGAGKWGPSHE